MNYSDFFNGGSVSAPRTENRTVYNPLTGNRTTQTRMVAGGGSRLGAAPGGGLDDILAGLDKESEAYVENLKGIYDSYQGYVTDFNEDIEPIMAAMDKDIEGLEDYMGDYQGLLSDMKPTFTDGIDVEASASNRRAEYMGAVGDQFGAAEDSMKREMAGQGLNYYANKGAGRDFKLKRAAGMSTASNKAYADWREQHNRDVQAKQAGMATYADLSSREGDMRSNIINARGGMAGMHKGIMDTRLAAETAKASGYEGLLGLTEGRRTEALELGKHQQGMRVQASAANANMATQLTGGELDQWKWDKTS